MLEEITRFVSAVGFPIFVGVWLLTRTETILRENTKATVELTAVIHEWLRKNGHGK